MEYKHGNHKKINETDTIAEGLEKVKLRIARYKSQSERICIERNRKKVQRQSKDITKSLLKTKKKKNCLYKRRNSFRKFWHVLMGEANFFMN